MIYAVASLAQLSFLMALYKIPATKQINKYTLSAWTYFFATVLAGIMLHNSITFDARTLFLAFLWGTGYAVLTLTQMHVLHTHDTSSVFPFTSLASNILVIIGGVFLLNEVITLIQWIAIALAILIFVAAYWNNKVHFVFKVLPAFAFISLLSTFNKFVQKAGSDHVDTHNFIFWQLAFALVVSLAILFSMKKHISLNELAHRHLLKWAFISGVLQAGTAYTMVMALSLGPISLVYVIVGLCTFFTSLLAALFFKEKITRKSLFFIALSFLTVLLIKFG